MLKDIIIICLLHFVGDFLCQSRDMGKRKSEECGVLLGHGAILYITFAPAWWLLGLSPWFIMCNTIIHMLIDWNIWRGYKRWVRRSNLEKDFDINKYEYWKDRLFYTTIGFDQFLHYITIIALYDYFK